MEYPPVPKLQCMFGMRQSGIVFMFVYSMILTLFMIVSSYLGPHNNGGRTSSVNFVSEYILSNVSSRMKETNHSVTFVDSKESPASPAASSPLSRVFVAYLPFLQSHMYQIDEAFGLVESWRYVFSVKEDPQKEFSCNTSKLHESTVTVDLSLLGRKKNFLGSPKVSAPLINDILIITDPRMKDSYLPSICDVLYNSNGQSSHKEELENRLKEAQKIYAVSPDSDEIPRVLSRCYVLKTYITSTQFQKVWLLHPAINSVSALMESSVSDFLLNYDLMFRSDNDCFITPGINKPQNIPWKIKIPSKDSIKNDQESEKEVFSFFVGRGGYASLLVNKLLPEYSKVMGLQHQGIQSIGSAWYGRPDDAINAARLTERVGAFLMSVDPVMLRSVGEWPKWFRGVTLLYSAEIALNHLFDKSRLFVRADLMDTSSTANTNVLSGPMIHIHCWHTHINFSKFSFRFNVYNVTFFDNEDYDFKKASGYAFANSWNSRERRIAQNPISYDDPNENVLSSSKPFFYTPLSKKLLLSHFFACPVSAPYAAYDGSHCCKSSDCTDIVLPSVTCIVKPCVDNPDAVSVKLTENSTNLPYNIDECPGTHSYPYKNGSYCCAHEFDCLGLSIELSSDCCLKHAYVECRSSNCRPNQSIIGSLMLMGQYGYSKKNIPKMYQHWNGHEKEIVMNTWERENKVDLRELLNEGESDDEVVMEIINTSPSLRGFRKELSRLGYERTKIKDEVEKAKG